jgi:uncharacterized protein YbjT (DUF2867 family)
MSERVLVTGATGKVGLEVVRRLLEAGRDVQAATRSPNRAREILDAEVVEFDFDRAETYDGPIQWADRIFVVPPPFDPRAYATLSSFLDWAVQAGCDHVVVLTAMGVELREDLALRRVERLVEATGAAHTFLRPNVYMQNFHPGFLGREIREESRFHLPTEASRVSVVDARDVAAVAAHVLTSDAGEHDGRGYTLTGPEALDHEEIARILSEAVGREILYVPEEDASMAERLAELGWPREQVDVVLDFFRSIRDGVRAAVTPDVRNLLGRPAISFRDFAGSHADAWRA